MQPDCQLPCQVIGGDDEARGLPGLRLALSHRASYGRDMGLFSDRRVILACGAAGAVLLGVGAAALVIARAPAPKGPPPASKGGLVVEQGPSDSTLDPARPLRCFVGGQMAGTMTLAECAKKN